jgi:hypothetical protein
MAKIKSPSLRKKPLLQRRNKGYLIGRRDWTRTNDPHHVKVVL